MNANANLNKNSNLASNSSRNISNAFNMYKKRSTNGDNSEGKNARVYYKKMMTFTLVLITVPADLITQI